MTKVNPVPEQSTVRGCPESCFAMVQGKILKMKRGNFKKVFISSVLILLGFIFGLGISVFAWVNPSQNPPLGGGVLQTDNSGLKIVTTTQITTGNFTVNTGNVGIGTTNPNNLLQVVDLINFDNTYFNTFLGYQAGKNVVSGAAYNTFIGYQAGFTSTTSASSTADYNTAIGYQALFSNTTGYYNTAVGAEALYSNTTGYWNVALGSSALYSNTTGYSNIAVGDAALYFNTTGYSNTAVGDAALYSNTTGYYNTAVGAEALYSNTTGYRNVALGSSALYSNTTGSDNIAIGYQALYSQIRGGDNIAIGSFALQNSTSTLSNIAIGSYALYSNETGDSNSAFGGYALFVNTTGSDNTAIGGGALFYNSTGRQNTAVGKVALFNNTTGYYNTAVGYFAGTYIGNSTTSNATSTYSVYLGAHTRASFSGATNEIVIGYGAVGAGSNSVVLGNDSITRTILKGNVGIGMTTPTARLHVFDSFRGNIKLLTTSGVGNDFGYDGGPDSAFWFTHTGAEAGYTLFRWDTGTSFRDLLYIGNSGNVGIGTSTPSQRLTVLGNIGIQAGANAFIGTLDNYALSLRTNNTDRIFITNAGNVGIGTTAPSTRLAVAGLTSSQAGRTICSDTSGNFYYYAGSCVSSSIKYKTNIQNLGIGLETLLKLRPVTFEFKKDYGGYDGTIHMGFIAEEVEQVTPILVDYNNGEVSGVRYSELTALIVKSIQEQQNEIKDLKKEIEELKKMITR
jgi:hypothetical protein